MRVQNARGPQPQNTFQANRRGVESLVIKEKAEVPEMSVTSALQVQQALQEKGIALFFADLVKHESYSRVIWQPCSATFTTNLHLDTTDVRAAD